MAVGPQLIRFKAGLGRTGDNLDDVRDSVQTVRDKINEARRALETPGRVADDADTIGDKINHADQMIKVVGQVGPLKSVSTVLSKVLQSAKRVSDNIEKKARDLQKKIDKAGYTKRLEDAEEKLLEKEGEISDLETRVSGYQDTTGQLIYAFDTVGNRIQPLSDAVDDLVKPPNKAVGSVNDVYEDVSGDIDGLTNLIQRADFTPVLRVGNEFARIKEFVCQIDDVLSRAYSILKPVAPLLNAVGFVYNLTVKPAVDFVLKTIGIDKIMDRISAQIERLLPDTDFLDRLVDKIEGVFGEISDLLDRDFGVEKLRTRIEEKLLDPVTDATKGETGIGTEDGETLEGDSGRDILDPRGGDDEVLGRGGNDVLMASAGDDVLNGGGRRDTAVFSGNFAEYTISQLATDSNLIVSHAAPRNRKVSEGLEVLVSIEDLTFADLKTTVAELTENTKTAAGPELRGTKKNDFLFGEGNDDREDDPVAIYGRAGDDRITGTVESGDILNGGSGDDTFNGVDGEDVINGGKGRDTFLVTYGTTIKVDLLDRSEGTDGAARFGGLVTTLNSIENVSVQVLRDADVFGTSGTNILKGGKREDFIDGRGGNDRLFGGDDDDFIIGGEGRDTVFAGAGNDLILAGGRAASDKGEFYDGGEGRDTLIYSKTKKFGSNDNRDRGDQEDSTAVKVRAADGEVQRLNAAGKKVVATDSFVNIERIVGSDVDDVLRGASDVSGNQFSIDGAGGDDKLYSNGTGRVDGGSGDDRLYATASDFIFSYTQFFGGQGRDVLDLTRIKDANWFLQLGDRSGNSRLEAFKVLEGREVGDEDKIGNATDNDKATRILNGKMYDVEVVRFGDGDDEYFNWGNNSVRAFLGKGNDRFVEKGSGNRKEVFGGQGDDYLALLQAGGILHGGSGDDEFLAGELSGTKGSIFGGQGGDFVTVGRFDGTISGGSGFDTLSVRPDLRNVEIDLDLGQDSITGRAGGGSVSADLKGFEQVIGTTGRDIIRGSSEAGDRLIGGPGDDVIEGRGGSDELFGGAGFDEIFGGAGDDLLHGGGARDKLDGGAGVDTASYADAVPGGRRGDVTAESSIFGRVVADLDAGFADVYGPDNPVPSREELTLIENIVGGLGNDELRGDAKRNSLTGGAGNDLLDGRGDRDTLIMGEGNDTALGGRGNDRIVVGPGRKTIDGGGGTDSLDLGTFSGEVEIDFAANRYTASFDVEIPVWADSGGVGARVYNGNRYTPSDVQETEAEFANDRSDLSRELPPEPTDPEADRTDFERFKISYKTASEKSSGTFASIEKIIGGTAAAVILPSLARDRFDGRADAATSDTIDMSGESRGVDFDLRSGKTNNAKLRDDDYKGIEGIIGTKRGDDLRGDEGANVLTGLRGSDKLFGRDGSDHIHGGDGRDQLSGGDGKDELTGNKGADLLIGGAGSDDFNFVKRADSTRDSMDVIDGFDGAGRRGGDQIDVSAIDAVAGKRGNQKFDFGDDKGRGDLWAENDGRDTIIYGNIDGDRFAEIQIRIEDGRSTSAEDYNSRDFIL